MNETIYATFDTNYAKDFDIGTEVKMKVEDSPSTTGGNPFHNITEMIGKDEEFASNDNITSENTPVSAKEVSLNYIETYLKRIAEAVEKIAKEYPPTAIIEEKVEG